jgi:hypothetical protein
MGLFFLEYCAVQLAHLLFTLPLSRWTAALAHTLLGASSWSPQ